MSARQYSDFFSLLFGDEDKENSTASWDYELETESTNVAHNTTNEMGLLDAIKELSYGDGNKQNSAVKQTNVTNQTDVFVPNIPTYNVSDGDGSDDADDADDDDDDDEEISILDFFLKGESAFTSTTMKPFVFNVTSKPLLNGMTNSPMQIQPILPDGMKNESLKFSMLPMSLYNMVKEDGSLIFDEDKSQAVSAQVKPSHPPHTSSSASTILPQLDLVQSTIKEQQTRENPPTSTPTAIKVNPTAPTTTHRPTQTTTIAPKKPIDTSTLAAAKVKTKNNTMTHTSNQIVHVNSPGIASIKNITTKQSVSSTQKIVESSTITIKTTPRVTVTTPKPITSSFAPANVTRTTTTQTTSAPTKPATTRKTTNTPKIVATTTKATTKIATTPTTTKAPKISTTIIPLKPLTTHATPPTTAIPKITAVQINSNPSILDADVNYDYSEPTLPPSLPNLRIIPFLPTDAVKKGEVHKIDAYKSSNYNYYHLSPTAYSETESSSGAPAAYSPFNIKPPIEKQPAYNGNIADDRIDYDTYKMPPVSLDSLDYISAGNLIQPQTFQMSVNSKLDYEPNHDPHKVIPSKIPIVPSKNLTVKPPLPPFEPEHEYSLYNNNNNHNNRPPSQPTLYPGGYHEYSVNAPNANEPYASEHNYNVPHFVTIPPLKEPPRRPIHNKESVFSYANKNKFIPPAKTEGKIITVISVFIM